MENKTIGGIAFSTLTGKRAPAWSSREKFSPSTYNTKKSGVLGGFMETELVKDFDNDCFIIKINKSDGSEIASTKIRKSTGEILEIQPKNKDDRLEIFEKIFSKNMLDFSKSCGMLPLDLVLCLSLLYGEDKDLRLFFQQIYAVGVNDIDSYKRIYNSINNGIIINVLGTPRESGHIDVVVKLDNNNFRIFDTAWNSPIFIGYFYDIADSLSNGSFEKDKEKILLIKESPFQGEMSCFLMIFSFLEICEERLDFLANIEKYFENTVGRFMVLQQLLALISDDKNILELEIKKDNENIKISKISSKFILEKKEINEDFFVHMKWFNKYIPLDDLINIQTVRNLLNGLNSEKESIEYEKPSFISKTQGKISKKYTEDNEYADDEKYFQKLLNKYLRILCSGLNKDDYYFSIEEQNELITDFIDTTVLTRLNNNNNNIIFGYREKIRDLIPEFDTNIEGGSPVNFIYTLGTEHNKSADAGNHYVAAQVFINPETNKLTVLHYDALRGELDQEFVNYIHSNFDVDNVDIINIPLTQSLRQTSNNTCGLYALTALRDGGVLDKKRKELTSARETTQQQAQQIRETIENEYSLPKQRRELEKLIDKEKKSKQNAKIDTKSFLKKEIDKKKTQIRKKEREIKQEIIEGNSWKEKENIKRNKALKTHEL